MNEFEFERELQHLAQMDRPDPEDMQAESARLGRALARRSSSSRRRRVAAGVAAAVLIAVLGVLAWRDTTSPELWVLQQGDARMAPGVAVRSEGQGTATVGPSDTHVHWVHGRLSVEVDPTAQQQVTIETPSAVVRVVGTVFTVEHSTFGTVVEVARGRVQVECRDGLVEEVIPGAEAWCFHDTAWGLGRLLWLEGHDAPAEKRLRVIRRALAHPVGRAATRDLLLRREVDTLVQLDRITDAVATARKLPARLRTTELAVYADRAMEHGGCAAAEPWLDALLESGDVTGGLLLVQCLADPDAPRARSALQRVMQLHPVGADAVTAGGWHRVLSPPR